MIVYAVVYSNYEPSEVDSLYAEAALEKAENRARSLNAEDEASYWHVIPWEVED